MEPHFLIDEEFNRKEKALNGILNYSFENKNQNKNALLMKKLIYAIISKNARKNKSQKIQYKYNILRKPAVSNLLRNQFTPKPSLQPKFFDIEKTNNLQTPYKLFTVESMNNTPLKQKNIQKPLLITPRHNIPIKQTMQPVKQRLPSQIIQPRVLIRPSQNNSPILKEQQRPQTQRILTQPNYPIRPQIPKPRTSNPPRPTLAPQQNIRNESKPSYSPDLKVPKPIYRSPTASINPKIIPIQKPVMPKIPIITQRTQVPQNTIIPKQQITVEQPKFKPDEFAPLPEHIEFNAIVESNISRSPDGQLTYNITELVLDTKTYRIFFNLQNKLFSIIEKSPELIDDVDFFTRNLKESVKLLNIGIGEINIEDLKIYLKNYILGFHKLQPLVKDTNIKAIYCSGANQPILIQHIKYGKILTNLIFNSNTELDDFIKYIARKAGKTISVTNPALNIEFPNNIKFNATLGGDFVSSKFILLKS